MKRKFIRMSIIICVIATGSFDLAAQDKKPVQPEPKGREAVVFKVIGPKFAMTKVVKGAPYSATAFTETVQTLSDGNQIIRKNESKLYRDGEGRTRSETTLETIGKWTAAGAPSQMIHINDPVTGYYYDLDPGARTAFKSSLSMEKMERVKEQLVILKKLDTMQKGTDPVAKTTTAIELMEELEKRKQEKLKAVEKKGTLKEGADSDRKKTESLGKQMIEGIEAEGTRVTTTIPAGEIGNTLPIEIVEETWRSPELQMVVMSKHRDPRSGETTYRLTNIDRGEPDRSLFEIPADYTVKQGRISIKKKQAREEE